MNKFLFVVICFSFLNLYSSLQEFRIENLSSPKKYVSDDFIQYAQEWYDSALQQGAFEEFGEVQSVYVLVNDLGDEASSSGNVQHMSQMFNNLNTNAATFMLVKNRFKVGCLTPDNQLHTYIKRLPVEVRDTLTEEEAVAYLQLDERVRRGFVANDPVIDLDRASLNKKLRDTRFGVIGQNL